MSFCCLDLQVGLGWKGYDSGGQDICSAEVYQFTKSTVLSFSIQLSVVLADSKTTSSTLGRIAPGTGWVVEIEVLVCLNYSLMNSWNPFRVGLD